MNLDDRAIQTHRFDLDANELLALHFGKQPIEHAGLRPAIHAQGCSETQRREPSAYRQIE
jgi:hypothetical protein